MAIEKVGGAMTGKAIKELFAQQVRAGVPFDPVGEVELFGGNLSRLQQGMRAFGWRDPRFVSQAEAEANGWSIADEAVSVQVQVRDRYSGQAENVVLFNAENVAGMPTLAEMLAMPDEEIVRLREGGASGVEVMPAREVQREGVGEEQGAAAGAAGGLVAAADVAVKLQPGYFRLVDHGAAPYQHDKANSGSYFAVLEDAQGIQETVWGVDIERSLSASGVQVGDAIVLSRGGKMPVTINEKQPDGSFVEKTVERVTWETRIQPIVAELPLESTPNSKADAQGVVATTDVRKEYSGRFAVTAPYWLNGLHNSKGIELVKEINAVIKDKGLDEQERSIEQLLLVYPDARRFGLKVVVEELFLEDPHWKRNLAEPVKLLDGRFVRDKDGAYRSVEGGRAVLVDKGDSLSLNSRDKDGYAAAMELAIAKGWTAIELKGKPAMLADAWLEAKLRGLDVVNYSPTKEDIVKYQDRLAKDAAEKVAAMPESVMQETVVEQSPEQVIVKPFVDAAGQTKVATVVYTVTWGRDVGNVREPAKAIFDNPKEAAAMFADTPAATLPLVVRAVTRADGYVEADVTVGAIKGTARDGLQKYANQAVDHEFSEIFEALQAEKYGPVVIEGSFSGMIVDVQDGYAIQKVGRDPSQLVRHPLSRFDSVPEKGKVADIAYDKGGRGMVKSKAKELEREDGRVELER